MSSPSGASGPPKGQRDLSSLRLTKHALDRFLERFWTGPPDDRAAAEAALRAALTRTRRLGRHARSGAVAALAAYEGRMLILIVQDDAGTTVLTWPQFEPKLPEFGRARLPRKPGRMMRRLGGEVHHGGTEDTEEDPESGERTTD